MFGSSNAWGQQNQQQQQPQQQQGGMFGGGTTGGFGAQQNTGGFGSTTSTFGQPAQQQQPAAGGLFGGGGGNTSSFGGFGSNNASTSTFGARPQAPGFGATGSGMFGGGGTTTSTFGAAPATNTFGASSNVFGAKPATTFGAPAASPSGGLFGAKTTGFGSTAQKYNPDTPKQLLEPPLPTQGTAQPGYEPTWIQEGDKNTKQTNHLYHSICLMEPYQGASPEELRLQDYQQNRKTASAPPATGFGATSTFGGGFGQQAQAGPSGTSSTPATGFGGGFGSTSTGFGAQPAPATGGGLFGQQQPAQQTSGGLFGQQQPAQPAQGGGLFGSAPASTGFGAAASTPAPSFGGFGAPKPAASPFGGFGAQAQPAAPATSGFGAQPAAPAAAPSFGGFGAPAAPAAPATGGGLFGGGSTGFGAQQPASTGLFGGQQNQQQQQQQQPASTGGLFGSAPKPAGGLFGGGGATTTASSFGGFGNTSTTTPSTGGLFGSTNTNTNNNNNTGGGLFGSQNQQQQPQQQQQQQAPAAGGLFGGNSGGTGGLFGAKPATAPTGGLFGSAPAPAAPAPSFGGFGASQTGGGGLFGAKPAGGGLFGNLGQSQQQPAQQTSSLFGSTQQQPQQQQQQQQQQQLTASVDQNAYGNNPLFQFQAPPLDFTEKKKAPLPPLSSSFRHGTPNSAKRVTRLRGFASPASSTASPRPLATSTGRPLLSGLSDEPLSPNAFAPRASVKRLNLESKPDGGEFLSSVLGKSLAAPPTPRSPAVDSPRPAATARATPQRIPAKQDRAPIRKGDYWSQPDAATISSMSHMELTAVSDFVAGRMGYGQVAFLEPVDLTSLPSIGSMLGKIIVFEELTCEVYPDESDKPPVGSGLNVPAKITLENCWPKDKGTGDLIKDRSHPRMDAHIRRLKKVPETDFVEFDADAGVWTFKVQHFSKYGLVDSDDEEDVQEQQEDEAPPMRTMEDESYDEEESVEEPEEKDEEESEEATDIFGEEEESDEEMFRSMSPPEPPTYDEPKRTSRPWTASLGPDGARKVQVMQASLFKSKPQVKRGFEHAEEDTVVDNRDVKRRSFGEDVPMVVRQKVEYKKTPLVSSVSKGGEGALADAGLALGRSFRAGWGPNGELVHLGRIAGPKATVQAPSASQVMVQTVEVFAQEKATEVTRSLKLLQRQLDHTSVDLDDGVPVASTSDTLRFSHFASAFSPDDRAHEASVWSLGHALFDEIPEGALRRKLALTEWLESVVAPAVEHDLLTADDAASKVFALLSGNQTERATQAATDAGDVRLATLVAQAGGPQEFRDDILLQLTKWSEYSADAHISVAYRKVYALLAGIVDVSLGVKSRDQMDASPDVVVAAGLDWKRAFGLHLWHGTSFDASIPEALTGYQTSLSSDRPPARPLPPYVEKAQKWRVRDATDILFGLVRVFSDQSLELDAILHASEASASPIDHRVPWHIYTVLSRVLRLRDFADREGDMADDEEGYSATADRVTASYASQLEALGLWQWSIYVLLHLQMPESREKAIRDVLFRHPEPTDVEREFVTGQMRVPAAWLAESKAASLAAQGDAYGEYKALLEAGLYDPAHRIVVDKLASEAVVRDDLQLLRRLFAPLEHRRIGNWDYGGRLFLDYADVRLLVPELVNAVRGAAPDAAQLGRLQELAQALPRILQLLPLAFPNKQDVQQIACLSEMLSALHKLAGPLHLAGYISRPPVPPLLVDADRLQLLQSAAFDAFNAKMVSMRA